jgi:rhodanese-related sulfurtransferase
MIEVSPREAFDLMTNDPDYIYLDVRSVPEFDGGHPQGALNIPIMHFAPGAGMYPNEEFIAVVQANLPKHAKIVVGCKTGMRSGRACELLVQIGYTSVANVRGGFAGLSDNFGRLVEPGWSMLNLPIATEAPAENRYETLAASPRST